MDEDCGQYTVRTVRTCLIRCANPDGCRNMRYVNAVGDIPDDWENLSRWGYDITFCPVCKMKLQMKCVDPDVCLALDMIGAPYELDYIHRCAYEYRFDQTMRIIKEIRQARKFTLADSEGSVCGSN